ncbi:hypothetical protein CRG98_018182 [Punica granatum]|uniref:Uncharacterized protein n=1 Tax=Punica granatum TaxID=22663 RepID=A0A2I0JYJ2_PUNGR|nr:hypothetical protein CRG98_018182 [Punica granatum]
MSTTNGAGEAMFPANPTGVVLCVLVPPRGAYGDHVDGGPRTQPMIREGVGLHIWGPDGVESEPVAVNPLLDLVSQPPTIIESMPRCALMILAAFRLILRGRVKVRARGYRLNLIARKKLPIYGSAAPVEGLSTPGAWFEGAEPTWGRSGGRKQARATVDAVVRFTEYCWGVGCAGLMTFTETSFPLLSLEDDDVAGTFFEDSSPLPVGPSILLSLIPKSSFFSASMRSENEEVWASRCE